MNILRQKDIARLDAVKMWSPTILAAAASLLFIVFGVIIVGGFSPKTFQISFLDVGQGDAIYVRSQSGTNILIDGGPDGNVIKRLSEVMPRFDRTIDLVVATHADVDHLSGLIDVVRRFKVGGVIVTSASSSTVLDELFMAEISKRNIPVYSLHAGDSVSLGGGVVLRVLLPYVDEVFGEAETNESSLVALLTHKDFSALLTGDADVGREALIIGDAVLPESVTVLKLGHHGSRTSTGNSLLSSTRPEVGILSFGSKNRYGHPHQEVLERLKRHNVPFYSTASSGTISFVYSNGQYKLQTSKALSQSK